MHSCTISETWDYYYYLNCKKCKNDVLIGKYTLNKKQIINNTLELLQKINTIQNVTDIHNHIPHFLANYEKKISLQIINQIFKKIPLDIINHIIDFLGIYNINNILHHKKINKYFSPIDQSIFYIDKVGIIYCNEDIEHYLDENFLCYECISTYKLLLK